MRSPDAEPKLPLKLFISYAHEDEELRKVLVEHLAQSVREGLLEIWSDRNIAGGSAWEGDIDENLESAHIVVLLVSRHFLDSKYCQREAARAMERGVRTVPVILRPADWETAPFAALQAYPTDGKPVVKWRPQDSGFLNVVKGLRRVVDDVAGKVKIVRLGGLEIGLPKQRFGVWAIAPILLVAIGLGIWWSAYRSALRQGEAWLDVGRFDLAEPYLRRAAALNRLSGSAATDIAAVEVNASRKDSAKVDRLLTPLLESAPSNPYLKLLRGDQFFSAGQLDAAKKQYQAAVYLRPSLADGYWRLGIVHGLERDRKTAVAMLRKAVELSPESARYLDNLAGESLRSGDIPQAAEQYEAVAERGSPIAAIEAASARRLLGDLRAAEHNGQRALELMQSELLPEYQVPWRVDRGDEEHFSLESANEKLCYAEAEYSATLAISRKAPDAQKSIDSSRQLCGSRWEQVEKMLRWQLGLVAERQPTLSAAIREHLALLAK